MWTEINGSGWKSCVLYQLSVPKKLDSHAATRWLRSKKPQACDASQRAAPSSRHPVGMLGGDDVPGASIASEQQVCPMSMGAFFWQRTVNLAAPVLIATRSPMVKATPSAPRQTPKKPT